MAIRTVVTRGFGNATFNGTVALVVTRGYQSGEAVEAVAVTDEGAWYPVYKTTKGGR